MWYQLDATISDFIVNQLFLNMLLATYPTQCTQLASQLSKITTVTTGQITICSENAVWPPEDGRKDARNMLRNNWLTIKSLIVASSWSHIYLLIKDARSLEHKVFSSSIYHWTQLKSRSELQGNTWPWWYFDRHTKIWKWQGVIPIFKKVS